MLGPVYTYRHHHRVLHCVNGNRPLDGGNGFCTQSAHQTVRFHWQNVRLWRWRTRWQYVYDRQLYLTNTLTGKVTTRYWVFAIFPLQFPPLPSTPESRWAPPCGESWIRYCEQTVPLSESLNGGSTQAKFWARVPLPNFLHLHAVLRKIWPNNRWRPLGNPGYSPLIPPYVTMRTSTFGE